MPGLPPLPIETVLAVDQLESGRVLVRPLAGLELAAYGDEDECLLEMELFLSEQLRRLGANAQARFSMPGPIEPRHVEVELVRTDLPERVAKPLRAAMPCAVIPDGRARWVVVLPLALTVHVRDGEDLDEVVAAEARRHLGVIEPGPRGTLALLPARAHRLERRTVTIERRSLPDVLGSMKRADEAQRRRHALSVLRTVARRVHAGDVRGPAAVGLERPLAMLDALLSGERRAGVLLVGEERAGKTTLVHEWLRSRGERDAPLLFATSGAQLVAGMSLLGQWQERVRRVMAAAETLDAILWLDDLRDLLGDAHGHVDLAAAIKPWLDEGRVRVIGELTPEAADLFATRQAGLYAALMPLRVEPQDARAGRAALRACIEHARAREPHRARLHESAIDAIVELTDRFQPYRPFPGKAVRLYDELRSSAERGHHGLARELGPADVYDLFSVQTGIPLFLLRDDVAWRTEHARAFFERRLVGQREAIERLVGALAVVKAGLAPGDRPLASFLFVGPTGVGKTAVARALAELLFGSAERLVRFDMSEMADPFAAERLIRGTDSDEGLLTSRVRQQPFCVVLLDEIEKAHPSVFDLLLQVLGEGRLTDARGRTAYFHDAIIVMTSNLGARHRARRVGIDPPGEDERGRYVEAIEGHFRPELVNRIDRIVPFEALDRAQIRAVAEQLVARVSARAGLVELGVSLEVTPRALDLLAARGFEEAYGARAMRRHVEDQLVAPLARLLAPLGPAARNARAVGRLEDEPGPEGHRLAAARIEGGFVLEILRGAERSAREDAAIALEVAERRRWARAQLELPTVEDRVERAAYLLAELSYGKRESIDPRTRQQMQAEHHRLREALAAVERAIADLETIEELAIGAALGGEDGAAALREEARAADLAFRSALLGLLLDADPRHEITLVAQEWDSRRGLDRWLGGLIAHLDDFEWQLTAHVHRDPAPAPPDWPKERAYGPPRTAAEIAERLARTERDMMSVLLCVRGPHAGTLLALEAGVHRDRTGGSKDEAPTFVVRSLAQRASLTANDWGSRRILPGPIPFGAHSRLTPAAREVHADHVVIDEGRARVDVAGARYWAELRAIALTHLIALEARPGAREALLASPLDAPAEAEAP